MPSPDECCRALELSIFSWTRYVSRSGDKEGEGIRALVFALTRRYNRASH